jgi:hypothetical protein
MQGKKTSSPSLLIESAKFGMRISTRKKTRFYANAFIIRIIVTTVHEDLLLSCIRNSRLNASVAAFPLSAARCILVDRIFIMLQRVTKYSIYDRTINRTQTVTLLSWVANFRVSDD